MEGRIPWSFSSSGMRRGSSRPPPSAQDHVQPCGGGGSGPSDAGSGRGGSAWRPSGTSCLKRPDAHLYNFLQITALVILKLRGIPIFSFYLEEEGLLTRQKARLCWTVWAEAVVDASRCPGCSRKGS